MHQSEEDKDEGYPRGYAAGPAQSTQDARERLRALEACERRMGLSKTSWEEDERQGALNFVQAERDKKKAAALAAERRFLLSESRGKPSSARPHQPEPAVLSRISSIDICSNLGILQCAAGGDWSRGMQLPLQGIEGEYSKWQDEGFDVCDDSALSRIAQVAAAINKTNFEVGEKLGCKY
jgi:hypothetical protein